VIDSPVSIPAEHQTEPDAAVWPGASYFTWAGIDGYDWTGKVTFTQTFGAAVAAVRAITSKPVLIAETSVVPGPHAASQVASLFAGIRADGLIGLVWFNTDKNGFKNTGDTHDWQLQDDPLHSPRSELRSRTGGEQCWRKDDPVLPAARDDRGGAVGRDRGVRAGDRVAVRVASVMSSRRSGSCRGICAPRDGPAGRRHAGAAAGRAPVLAGVRRAGVRCAVVPLLRLAAGLAVIRAALPGTGLMGRPR
jgi:hypothetical protein